MWEQTVKGLKNSAQELEFNGIGSQVILQCIMRFHYK